MVFDKRIAQNAFRLSQRKYLFQPPGVILHPAAVAAKAVGSILPDDPLGGNAHVLHQAVLGLELPVEGILCPVAVTGKSEGVASVSSWVPSRNSDSS